jgi:hypothetical protein
MKSLRFALPLVLLSLSTAAFAQHEGHDAHAAAAAPAATAGTAAPAATPAPETDAHKSFVRLKTLAGTWEGPVTTTPKMAMVKMDPTLDKMDGTLKVSLQVTSSGKTITHEMSGSGPHVNPVSVVYLDGDRLLLTHYCAMGNRPRMSGKMQPDATTVKFDFVDVDGGTENGMMHDAAFTFIDADHHNEDWEFFMPGEKTVKVHAHAELHRVPPPAAVAAPAGK